VRKKASTHVPEWRKNETHDEVLRKSEDKLSEIPIPVKETEELPKRITLNRPPSASAPKIETQPKNERGEENALKQQRFGKVDRNALKNNNRR